VEPFQFSPVEQVAYKGSQDLVRQPEKWDSAIRNSTQFIVAQPGLISLCSLVLKDSYGWANVAAAPGRIFNLGYGF
jgi:hypothetical protein